MSESLVVKIYLPKEAKAKYLYGRKRTVESKQTSESRSTIVSYFVILCINEKIGNTDLELLGTLSEEGTCQDGISLLKDQNGKIVRVLLHEKDVISSQQVLLLRFDEIEFLKSYHEHYKPKTVEENFALFIAEAVKNEHKKTNGKSIVTKISEKSYSFLACSSSIASRLLQPFIPVFKNTVIYQHCRNWRICLKDERPKNGFFVLDILLGVLSILLMYHVQHSGRYFMGSTEFIVNKLRKLLEMLDGSPAGLKLNVQLNNFLLGCFMYHVDLWWNFIVIVEPAIHYLFLPITLFGLTGFSFQCAMLCDVIIYNCLSFLSCLTHKISSFLS